MKKKAITIILIVFKSISFCSGQVLDGSLWVGGTLDYNSQVVKVKDTNDPDFKRQTISFRPYFGKSIDSISMFGIILGYQKIRDRRTTPGGRTTDDIFYGGGFFYRRYKSLGKRFFLFANGEIGYGFERIKSVLTMNPSDFKKSRINSISLTAYPGISYMLNKNIHLEMRVGNLFTLSLRDQKDHIEFPVNNKRDEHTFSIGGSTFLNDNNSFVGFGFRFLINRKMN